MLEKYCGEENPSDAAISEIDISVSASITAAFFAFISFMYFIGVVRITFEKICNLYFRIKLGLSRLFLPLSKAPAKSIRTEV